MTSPHDVAFDWNRTLRDHSTATPRSCCVLWRFTPVCIISRSVSVIVLACVCIYCKSLGGDNGAIINSFKPAGRQRLYCVAYDVTHKPLDTLPLSLQAAEAQYGAADSRCFVTLMSHESVSLNHYYPTALSHYSQVKKTLGHCVQSSAWVCHELSHDLH